MRILEGKRSALFGMSLLLPFVGGCKGGEDARREELSRDARLVKSAQWREGRFHNPQPLWMNNFKALLSMFSGSEHAAPKDAVAVATGVRESLLDAPEGGLRATWLGHSSVLLELAGSRLLIDPVWGERSSPVSFAGPKRWYAPPLAMKDVPSLDAVLISHDHYDHLDRGSIEALKERTQRFIVPLGVGALLEKWGVSADKITELDWWESTRLGRIQIHATPARHASGRDLFLRDKDRRLWCGYALVAEDARVYYSGDSGMQDAFAEIGRRLGPFDLTMIEVGEYAQEWPDWHAGPEQAVEAHRLVRGRVMLPVHWGLFELSNHGWTEPIERTLAAAGKHSVLVATPRPGQPVTPLAAKALPREPWWPKLPWRSAEAYPIVSTKEGQGDRRYEASVSQAQLQALARELRDQAYDLEQRGELTAADVALGLAFRLDELRP